MSLSANLVADYQFNGSLSSAIEGVPDLIDLGSTNSFATKVMDGQSVGCFRFAQGTGLQVSTADIIPNNQYSIALFFSFDTVSGYRRILDFKNRKVDTGFYTLHSKYKFFNVKGGIGTTTYNTGQYLKAIFTRDASGHVTAYLDGQKELSFHDSGNLALISTDQIVHFFRDNGGENSGGSVARILLFDDALSASDVASFDFFDPSLGDSAKETHQIHNSLGLALTVAEAIVDNDADVQANTLQDTDSQKWMMTEDGIIQSALGDFAMDMVPTDDENKHYLRIRPVDQGSATQKWDITDEGLLRNKSNGFVAVIIKYGGKNYVDAIAPDIAPYYPDFQLSKWTIAKT